MQRPKIRDSVYISCRADQTVFFFTTTRRMKTFQMNRLANFLLTLLTGEHTVEQILEALRLQPGFQTDRNVLDTLAFLERENILEEADAAPPAGWFSGPEAGRYARQFDFFGDFATPDARKHDYQRRLQQKKVAILGLGGAGSWLVQALVLAGVGKLVLIDPDRVEWSDLNRHALAAEPDIGRYKTEAVRDRAAALNSNVEIETHRLRITGAGDLAGLLAGCDLAINMADEPNANLTHEWTSHACMRLRLPHILGGGYNCKIGALGFTVIPFETACWYCIRTDYSRRDPFMRDWSAPQDFAELDRLVGASLGAIVGVVGHWHALEALRLLTGFMPPQWCNKGLYFDFLTDRVLQREVARDPECQLCGTGGEKLELDLETSERTT